MPHVISISSFSTFADELPGMDDGETSGSVTRVERMIRENSASEPDCLVRIESIDGAICSFILFK